MGKGRPPQDVGVQVRALLWLEVAMSRNKMSLAGMEDQFTPRAKEYVRGKEPNEPFIQVHRFGSDPHLRRRSFSLVDELSIENESLADSPKFISAVYHSPFWRLLVPPRPTGVELQSVITEQLQLLNLRRDPFLLRFKRPTPDAPFRFEMPPHPTYALAIAGLQKTPIRSLPLLAALFAEALREGALTHAFLLKASVLDSAQRFLKREVKDTFTEHLFLALLTGRLFMNRWDDLISEERYTECRQLIEALFHSKKRREREKQVIPSLAVNAVALLLSDVGPTGHKDPIDAAAQQRAYDLIKARFHLP